MHYHTGTKAVSLWSFSLFRSSLSVGRSSLRFRSSLHTFSSVVRGIPIKKKVFDFAPFGCTFLYVVFAVSRSRLLHAVVPLGIPAPVVFVPTATPPPVHYSVSLRLHFGRSLGGCIWIVSGFDILCVAQSALA